MIQAVALAASAPAGQPASPRADQLATTPFAERLLRTRPAETPMAAAYRPPDGMW